MDFFSFDDDYVRRLREGDRATVDHFVEYFTPLLTTMLRGRVRNTHEIADVRQEVFARIFEKTRDPSAIRDARKLGPFVLATCRNVLFEKYRIDGRTEPLPDHFDTTGDPGNYDDAIANGEQRARVRAVVERLPPKDRDILRAFFFAERDKDEICRAFNVDRAYLRVLLHRAKERFRAEYLREQMTPIGSK